MKPLLYVVCSGFDLTCEGEKRLSKNRRAVNCGAKEREGRKEGALSYSLGRREVEGPDLYVRRKPQCMACLPALLQDLCRKKRGGSTKGYRAIFTCDEVRGRRSTDDIRPWKILEIVAVEA